MTRETLKKAKELEEELHRIGSFLDACKYNRNIRFFKKKQGIAVTVSDYMRETKVFELSREQRDKFISMLQDEYDKKKTELDELS